jgi:hypothetical protein
MGTHVLSPKPKYWLIGAKASALLEIDQEGVQVFIGYCFLEKYEVDCGCFDKGGIGVTWRCTRLSSHWKTRELGKEVDSSSQW